MATINIHDPASPRPCRESINIDARCWTPVYLRILSERPRSRPSGSDRRAVGRCQLRRAWRVGGRSRSLGVALHHTKYDSHMSIQEYLVSSSGQMSLPAAARHRWHLDDGGPVDVLDLGFGVLTAPKGTARKLLDDLVTSDQHAEFVRSLDSDADLATT